MSSRCSYYGQENFLLSNRIVQIVLGFHPNQSSIHQLFHYCAVVVYVLPMIVYQFYQLAVSDIKSESTFNLVQKLLAILCIICTYSVSYFRFSTGRKLVAYLKRDYEQFLGKDELNILIKYTKRNKLYTIIFVNMCILYFLILTIPSILILFGHIFGPIGNVQLTLPFPVNNVFNAGLLYYCLLVYEIILLLIVLIITCSCYLSYLIFVQHACIQFSLLIFKIRQPFDDINITCKAIYREINEEDWIVDIIARYARITKFVELINNLSRIIYLVGILFATILIFFNVLFVMQLLTISQSTTETVECIIMIVASLLGIYINFYIGQMLINHNTATFDELCHVPFYMLSIKTQRMLLFMLTRSRRPCELSIGGIFVASHEIFAGLVQKVFSFAMIYYNRYSLDT